MREPNDVSRRSVVAGVAMMAAGGTTAQAREPDSARPKGPRVWLDMDQKELDDAYDQSVYAPNSEQVALRRTHNSAAVRARLGFKRVAYGTTPVEMLDIYATKTPNAPVMVFIHGGAWRAGSAKDNAEAAELFVNAGAHFVVLDFANVMELGGSLFPMVEQVRRGVAWVYKNAASFGGDPNRIFIAGRSSGSHLGGVVLITDWQKDFGLPRRPGEGRAAVRPACTTSSRCGCPSAAPTSNSPTTWRRRCRRSAISTRINCPVGPGPRHLRDAGIPAPDPRFRGRPQGGRQARHAAGRRGLQSLRDPRDHGQSLRPARARRAGADGAARGMMRCISLAASSPAQAGDPVLRDFAVAT